MVGLLDAVVVVMLVRSAGGVDVPALAAIAGLGTVVVDVRFGAGLGVGRAL